MSNYLRNMVATVGVVVLGGVGFALYTPQPATRTMAELRDAGIAGPASQRFAIICPERLTSRTRTRINRRQPGLLRPAQSYARVARLAVCFNSDGGNCFRPTDGLLRVSEMDGEIIIPSLRQDSAGVTSDGGEDADGEDTDVDDSRQYRLDGCEPMTCDQVDIAADAGTFTNPYANRWCGALNRLAMQPSPCMIANGWGRAADGGWCEEECGQVDCRRMLSDGGSRWFGFNVMPREEASGAACVPVECGVVAGDVPSQWL